MVTTWGFNFVVMRWGLDQVPPLTLSVLRFALAAFPALLLVPMPKARWQLVAAYGLFAFALQFGLLFTALSIGMPAGLASLVMQIQAFFTIGLVALLSHERPRAAQLAGAVLAASGLVLVATQLPGATRFAFAVTVAAALSWSIANLVVKRIPADTDGGTRGALAVVVWGSAWAALLLTAAALVVDGPATMAAAVARLDAAQWLGIAFQAWPTTLLAFGIWAWLLRLYPASLIAPFTLLVPIVGMTSAVIFLGEPVTWWKLAGAALVLGGLALNVVTFRR